MLTSSFLILTSSVLFTSFISGLFGVGGGLIMLAVLFQYFDVVTALIIQATMSIFMCVHRSWILRSDINWVIVRYYLAGLTLPFIGLQFVSLSFDKNVILLVIGLFSFITPMIHRVPFDIRRPVTAGGVGVLIGSLSFGLGAAGPLYNIFFINPDLKKDEVMATKALTSAVGLAFKLIFLWQWAKGIDAQVYWLIPIFLFHTALGTIWSESNRQHISERHFLLTGKWIIGGIGVGILYKSLAALV